MLFSLILDINELHELLTVTLVLKFLEIFAMDGPSDRSCC
jgi:hypothetical protein